VHVLGDAADLVHGGAAALEAPVHVVGIGALVHGHELRRVHLAALPVAGLGEQTLVHGPLLEGRVEHLVVARALVELAAGGRVADRERAHGGVADEQVGEHAGLGVTRHRGPGVVLRRDQRDKPGVVHGIDRETPHPLVAQVLEHGHASGHVVVVGIVQRLQRDGGRQAAGQGAAEELPELLQLGADVQECAHHDHGVDGERDEHNDHPGLHQGSPRRRFL